MTMRRREFVSGAALLAVSPAAAKTSTGPRRLAIFSPFQPATDMREQSSNRYYRAIFAELRRLGHIEGQNPYLSARLLGAEHRKPRRCSGGSSPQEPRCRARHRLSRTEALEPPTERLQRDDGAHQSSPRGLCRKAAAIAERNRRDRGDERVIIKLWRNETGTIDRRRGGVIRVVAAPQRDRAVGRALDEPPLIAESGGATRAA
jgi:hypothetical protein